MVRFEFLYDFKADEAPLDLIFHGRGTGDIPIMLSAERPDGLSIELVQRLEQGISDSDIGISVQNDGKDAVFTFLKQYESEEALQSSNSGSFHPTQVVFSQAGPGMATKFQPLKGQYKIVAMTILTDPVNYSVTAPYFIVTGSVSGLLGTDTMKRDIFSGVIAGLKWALFIGLLTSAVSVLIGVLYGIVSAYYGGGGGRGHAIRLPDRQ